MNDDPIFLMFQSRFMLLNNVFRVMEEARPAVSGNSEEKSKTNISPKILIQGKYQKVM